MNANPVLRRELLERWRGRRAFSVMTVYVGLLGGLTVLLVWIAMTIVEGQTRFGSIAAAGPTIGRFLFENLLSIVLMLVLFLAPAYAAAQISGERERRTLALLRITLVSPTQIVLGKLGAATAWLLLLIVVALPFAAIALFLGGVALPDLLRAAFTLTVMTMSVAAISIGISARVQRTTAALVATVLIVLGLTIGTLFGAVIEGALRDWDFGRDDRPVSTLVNPYVALADAVRADRSTQDAPTILTAFAELLPVSARNDDVFIGGVDVAVARGFDGGFMFEGQDFPAGFDIDGQFIDRTTDREPIWLLTSGAYAATGLLALLFARRRITREEVSA